MKHRFFPLLAFVFTLLLSVGAQAAVTCSISSTGFYSVYDALAASDNLNQSSYTLNCTRLATDSATFNYITFTDDGLNNSGGNNKAKLGANSMLYDFFTTSAYSVNWSKSQKCIIGSISFGSSLTGSQTRTYYSKVPAAQSGLPQGTYTDTVTVYASYNKTTCGANQSQDASSSFTVQISNVPSCQIAVPPTSLSFTYTAFQAGTSPAGPSTLQARCSTTLPYSIFLNSNYGVVSGLNYSLVLTNSVGATVLPSSSIAGNGALQPYFINGTMPASQAGTCAASSCAASNTHTVTVRY